MPFIFAIRDFKAVFKGVKLQKIFGLTLLRGLKKTRFKRFYTNTSPARHLTTTTSNLTTTTSNLTISPQHHHNIYVTIPLKPHLNVVRSDY